MADQLYLSYWLRGFRPENMLRHFEKMLACFPFSLRARSAPVLRIHAIGFSEPALVEYALEPPLDLRRLVETARQHPGADCAYQVEGAWDLWQFEQDWKLEPARVSLFCFGPGFEGESGEHLRIDFGLDLHYLPQPEVAGSVRLLRSNIQSLLRLVHELDNALAVERRKLWSESGENFAEKLRAALEE